jgi:hypothetical protein
LFFFKCVRASHVRGHSSLTCRNSWQAEGTSRACMIQHHIKHRKFYFMYIFLKCTHGWICCRKLFWFAGALHFHLGKQKCGLNNHIFVTIVTTSRAFLWTKRSQACGHRNKLWLYSFPSKATAQKYALSAVCHGQSLTFKNFTARIPAHSPTDGTRGGAVAGVTSTSNTPSKTSIHLCEETMTFPLSLALSRASTCLYSTVFHSLEACNGMDLEKNLKRPCFRRSSLVLREATGE